MLVVSGDEGWVKTPGGTKVAMLVGERDYKGQRCCRYGAATQRWNHATIHHKTVFA
jgi:hypothetical protein